ncbi:MAG TPA: hypothetical protein VFZ52_24595, partial [Chryseolinea sp.]
QKLPRTDVPSLMRQIGYFPGPCLIPLSMKEKTSCRHRYVSDNNSMDKYLYLFELYQIEKVNKYNP